MHTEFRAAVMPDELRALLAMDRRIFPAADRFPAHYWRQIQSYWLLVDGVKAGCCAFEPDVDFEDDRRDDDSNPPLGGSLYIATTGIVPRFQGRGLGSLMKCWQIAYARRNGFRRIVTNTRKSNKAMIRLNREYGFRVIRTTKDYYTDPVEPTVVMELRLR